MFGVYGIQTDRKDFPPRAEMVPGVKESSLYTQEGCGNMPVRWTNGMAKLVIPLNQQNLLKALKLELDLSTPQGTDLVVRGNSYELFKGQNGSGSWSKTFSLANVTFGKQVIIELLNDIWTPKRPIKGSKDFRTPGVSVAEIELFTEKSKGAKLYE